MPYERKDNEGTLWMEPREQISKKTNQPYKYYSGDATIDGKEIWITGFKNTIKTKDGNKEIMKLSFKEKKKTTESFPF